MSTSIYDIPLKTWDGQPNMLDNYRNKVTLFINVTTDCGNAPEYRIIEDIYQKYKDRGFEVVAIPTNQYCGQYIVYDEFVNGINCALDAKNYAEGKHSVTYNFSEIVNSNPGLCDQEEMDKYYPGRKEAFPRQLKEGEEPHDVYKFIYESIHNEVSDYPCGCSFSYEHIVDGKHGHGGFMFGNFEKYLFTKSGKFVRHYPNGNLMPRYEEVDYASRWGMGDIVNRESPDQPSGDEPLYGKRILGEEEYNRLCRDIEELL